MDLGGRVRRKGPTVLNLATAFATLSAIWVAAVWTRQAFMAPRRVLIPDTLSVANWRDYASEGIRVGLTDAAVTIVEFIDLGCPFCRKAESYLRDLRGAFPQEVAVVYRHLPTHGWSLSAAIASQCAADYDVFEAFLHAVFARGDTVGQSTWTALAAEVGIDNAQSFDACMRDSSTLGAIARDTLAATVLGVTGTPTFLVNNLRVRGFPGGEEMNSLVLQALGASECTR